jgi:hypothetical protein
MFITALFMIAKIWCPTTYDWIKKIWHIYTKEYYSAIKRNAITSFSGKWMELEIIMLSENKPGSQRQILHVFAHMQNLELKKLA